MSACGGGSTEDRSGEQEPPADTAPKAGTDAAAELEKAQLDQFGDAKLIPEQSEQGIYAELDATQRAEKLRESIELDKPECMDAVNQWGQLPEVREAAASLAAFARDSDTITHTLIQVPEETAKEALDTTPPSECSTYQATLDDGTTSSYTVEDIDMETVADDSRAFSVTTDTGEDQMELHTLIYRNGDYLAATSIAGPNENGDYAETLAAFAKKALERENEVLG
ncbi:MAG: hypothetical protein M0026_12380 [Nocardiopsaceae bacterium]|nr:hypothetical protein [Nocardiopsaceae bacterium]